MQVERTKMRMTCDRITLLRFLREQLEEDDRLDFLFHLDDCPNCWDAVYNATKAAHPHFYKRPPRKSSQFSDSEIRSLEGNAAKVGEEDTEEVFDVVA